MAEFSKLLEIKNVDNVLKLSGKGFCVIKPLLYIKYKFKEEGMKYLINKNQMKLSMGISV